METVKRKLLKTGDYTYMLTLPKEWVRVLKWRSKTMVTLERHKSWIEIRNIRKKKKKAKQAKALS